MEQKAKEVEITKDDLYSRQEGTFGKETMGKLFKMKVLIHGLRGLGCEVAKNIILAGPNVVDINDNNMVEMCDLGGNFYLLESDAGVRTRAEGTHKKLEELNPYVRVSINTSKISDFVSLVDEYDVIVVTEVIPQEIAEKIDNVCREKNKGFIYTAVTGLSGFCFLDYGPNFMINDNNGEECKQYIVRCVTNDNPGVVIVDEKVGGPLAFANGDYVTFREVEGMKELNSQGPFEIKWLSPMTFSIGDTTKFGEYISGGIVEQVKVPKHHKFDSFSQKLESPYYNDVPPEPTDYSKFGRPELLHLCYKALFKYHSKYGSLPKLNDLEACKEIVECVKEEHAKGKADSNSWVQNCQDFDEEVVLNLARWSRAEISPVCAFLGGVVAQEIVKFTGKYTPISQWLWFDFFETVKRDGTFDRTLQNSRFDDQIAIYGKEIQQKFLDLKVFMIGAGALGCEFLKNFSLMGVANGNGLVTVTDNDNIEVSNLNRQFLFRKENVHQSKSKTAARVIQQMNKNFKCKDMQSLVSPDTVNLFTDEFWQEQDFIINAVDNVQARKFIDSKCTWLNKILIDSGTLGTKAHVQLVVPHVTSCYNDSQDPQEESIAFCTLRNFPAIIEHCIEWSRDRFNGYFTGIVKDTQTLLTDSEKFYRDMVNDGTSTNHLEKLLLIKRLIQVKRGGSFADCVNFAFECFVENFDHSIRQLLHNFPADFIDPQTGLKFWIGSKRVPSPITFNNNDDLHVTFLASYAFIIAEALQIKMQSFNTLDPLIEETRKISASFTVPEFRVRNVFIKANENDKGDASLISKIENEEQQLIEELKKELSSIDNKVFLPSFFVPADFEKDDDSNHHIDFIHSASNLRALNYKIVMCDRHKSKMIAGRIVPAIATTTAAVTGLVCLQMYTLVQTHQIESLRGAFFNLAVNMFVLTEPYPSIKHRDTQMDKLLGEPSIAIPPNWTVWDKIEFKGPLSIGELISKLEKEHGFDIFGIGSGLAGIYMQGGATAKEKLSRRVEDVYSQVTGQDLTNSSYIVLSVTADKDGTAVSMPPIKYYLK